MTTHILSSTSAQAAVIDTSGTFDVLRLHEIIFSRLRAHRHSRNIETKASLGLDFSSTQEYQSRGFEMVVRKGAKQQLEAERLARAANNAAEREAGGNAEVEPEVQATEALERVKIMRVFDFTGVAEALGEINNGLEQNAQHPSEARINVSQREQNPEDAPENPPRAIQARLEIADSEDEDDEMLFTTTEDESPEHESIVPAQAAEARPTERSKPLNGIDELQVRAQEREPRPPKVGMIIIDNIAQVLSPTMKSNFVRGENSPV